MSNATQWYMRDLNDPEKSYPMIEPPFLPRTATFARRGKYLLYIKWGDKVINEEINVDVDNMLYIFPYDDWGIDVEKEVTPFDRFRLIKVE